MKTPQEKFEQELRDAKRVEESLTKLVRARLKARRWSRRSAARK